MRRIIRNIIVIALSVVMLLVPFSINSSAQEVNRSKYNIVSNTGASLYAYMGYVYDNPNQDVIKRVSSYSDFAIFNVSSFGSYSSSPVYHYNAVDVTYMGNNNDMICAVCVSSPFYMFSGYHEDESQMYSNPLILDTSKVTKNMVSTHGVCTYYYGNSHSNYYNSATSCISIYPKTNEVPLLSSTNLWQNSTLSK